MPEVIVNLDVERGQILARLREQPVFMNIKSPYHKENLRRLSTLESIIQLLFSDSVLYGNVTPAYAQLQLKDMWDSLYGLLSEVRGWSANEKRSTYDFLCMKISALIGDTIGGRALLAKTEMSKVNYTVTSTSKGGLT